MVRLSFLPWCESIVTISLTLHFQKPTGHIRVDLSEATGLCQGHGQPLEAFWNISLRKAIRTRNLFFEIPRVTENLLSSEDVLMYKNQRPQRSKPEYFG